MIMFEEKYEVLTPNAGFNGRRYGVVFKNGKGMATRHQAEVLVNNYNYSCPTLKPETKPEAKPETKPEAKPENKFAKKN
jgi:hypothetical protein